MLAAFAILLAALLPLVVAGSGLLVAFGVLAALSFAMEFDVFLVSRMKEECGRRRDNTRDHGRRLRVVPGRQLVLVPALMRLMGRWNWWLPHPLARALPRLELP